MQTTSTCSWCHHLNDAGQRSCDGCGHDAHVSRAQCRCSTCVPGASLGGIEVHQGNVKLPAAADGLGGLATIVRARAKPGPRQADKIDHLSAGRMMQYVIYHGLRNWPDQYVVRVWNVIGTGRPMMASMLPLIVTQDLGEARRVIPKGYVNVGRNTGDAACIHEIWV